ncbi:MULTISPECIES: helix-turn-helix domain-containing protein [Streptomyces]|uniref:Transposase n=1 Tax=Streptomyces rimosus subsp. rimosus TaxID=132474 RepID=A0ABY3YT42_STRRM|nr:MULTISPECIES: helix-turn-helix domain-containing protein [Streptomyces]KUJ32384.1 hypothetical protein ADK46_22835 [Streptomyces rimosus subsp. rimosus]UNZ00555.1 hypothetical protein SRIMR7_00210 [Streptomyces rimosus subsp. rimosus]UTH92539.1 hypothetical protein SRIMHP_00210 [Streptomyces rimosus subsp. rimosus]UTI00219.1 hypothetical protein SRIMHP_39440 [Streptomyces rimosus subsp. rimosus]UTI00704.1 hypothetical protein SRIMHP_41870 [Streptomyces rimosus subsp. rimosus]
MAYGYQIEHRRRLRAQTVLNAARECSHARIARETGLHVSTVRTWQSRFAEHPAERSDQPPAFAPVQAAQVTALVCQLPVETAAYRYPAGQRRSWPVRALARGIVTFVSASTVRRWLDQDVLKPWQHRSWIFITDPGFRTKAERILDPYARTFDGVVLGEDEYVISADEKTSIQARCHPTLVLGKARAVRANHT